MAGYTLTSTDEKSTTYEVSLSNRYSRMTSWQKALMMTERADRPSMDCRAKGDA